MNCGRCKFIPSLFRFLKTLELIQRSGEIIYKRRKQLNASSHDGYTGVLMYVLCSPVMMAAGVQCNLLIDLQKSLVC